MNRRQLLAGAASQLPARKTSKARNVVFVLTDDHRYDALGFLKAQPFLETPHLDSLAREGVHCKHAFVTTALCSPSRASILTGRYAHSHRIVDNNTAIPPGTRYFTQDLQKAGYATAFIGKWHMGNASDDPQPGFDHWVSFRGQGSYVPSANGLNVNGKRVPQKGYITDELTDYALDWLGGRPKDKPYFLYLSHKAVHGTFIPADRHKGRYKNAQYKYPESMATEFPHRPMWVRNQRNSWHGADFPYHVERDVASVYKDYAETLLGVDESMGRLLEALRKRGELDSTLIVYMGDNGHAFGEHGLIDKRTAYEESMRVPFLARCPELFSGGRTVNEMVANIDIMPTVFAAAGMPAPRGIDGRSLLPVLGGNASGWRQSLLYEYYWERNYPQTPTIFALREDRYKFIRAHGVWDLDELYDLAEDPFETRNLILSPAHKAIAQAMSKRMFETLKSTGGDSIPLYPDAGNVSTLRSRNRSGAAEFPGEWLK